MRREGGRVIWDAWENTSDINAVPTEVHFDAAQYEAELARAAADRGWEEPVDTVARLLEQILVDSGGFERWSCVLTGAGPGARSRTSPRSWPSPRASTSSSAHPRPPGRRPVPTGTSCRSSPTGPRGSRPGGSPPASWRTIRAGAPSVATSA